MGAACRACGRCICWLWMRSAWCRRRGARGDLQDLQHNSVRQHIQQRRCKAAIVRSHELCRQRALLCILLHGTVASSCPSLLSPAPRPLQHMSVPCHTPPMPCTLPHLRLQRHRVCPDAAGAGCGVPKTPPPQDGTFFASTSGTDGSEPHSAHFHTAYRHLPANCVRGVTRGELSCAPPVVTPCSAHRHGGVAKADHCWRLDGIVYRSGLHEPDERVLREGNQ